MWKQRKASDDIIAEKRSDALLNKERYYDPNDGQVYEFPAGWYEHYNRERNAYNKKNLQPLPDNEHGLWQKAPQNGERLIFQE